jgi:hypothetical protein
MACAVVVAALTIGGAGCGDLFDIDVALGTRSFVHDFGPSAGAIPQLGCSAPDDDACASLSSTVSTADASGIRFGCDVAAAQCFGEADVRITMPVENVDAGGFDGVIARQAVDLVRSIDIAYTIPVNTLTFAVPDVSVFVSNDDGLESDGVLIDTIGSLAAGQTLTKPLHLSIVEGSAAHAAIERGLLGAGPLTFTVVLAPRFTAGSALPGGRIQVDLQPTVRVALPWSKVLP